MLFRSNPIFTEKEIIASGGTSTGHVVLSSREMNDLRTGSFKPLPGTAEEYALLKAQAREWKWPITVFEKHKATEAQLYATRSPRILHLATHGFFLPESDIEELRGKGDRRGIGGVKPFADISLNEKSGSLLNKQVILKNPMHRDYLFREFSIKHNSI